MASRTVSIALDQESVERFSQLLYGQPLTAGDADASDRFTAFRGAIATGAHCSPPDGGTPPPKKVEEERRRREYTEEEDDSKRGRENEDDDFDE